MTPFIVCALVLLGVFLDQISKYLVVIYMEVGQSVDFIPGILRFTYVQNDGAAFGSLDDQRWIFMILSTVAIIAIFVYIFWKKPQNKLLLASLILIVSGGIGNMIDRVRLGYVVDFIDFCAFPKIWMWVFNIADSCVGVGAGMLMLWMILDMIAESKKEKAMAAVEAEKSSEGEETQNPDESNGDTNE